MGILPSEEYENELSNLLDNCPTKPVSVIQSVIESEFGKDLNEIFSDFDETPIGSGSNWPSSQGNTEGRRQKGHREGSISRRGKIFSVGFSNDEVSNGT